MVKACNHIAECADATKDAAKIAAAGSAATGSAIAVGLTAYPSLCRQAVQRGGAAIAVHAYHTLFGYPTTRLGMHAFGQWCVTGAQCAPWIITTTAGIVCLPTTPVGAAYCVSSYTAASLGLSIPATVATSTATFLASNQLPESWSVLGTKAYELVNQITQSSASNEENPSTTETNQATGESSDNNSTPNTQPSTEETEKTSAQDAPEEPKVNRTKTTVESAFSALYGFFRPAPAQTANAYVRLTPVCRNNEVEVKVRIDVSSLCR